MTYNTGKLVELAEHTKANLPKPGKSSDHQWQMKLMDKKLKMAEKMKKLQALQQAKIQEALEKQAQQNIQTQQLVETLNSIQAKKQNFAELLMEKKMQIQAKA